MDALFLSHDNAERLLFINGKAEPVAAAISGSAGIPATSGLQSGPVLQKTAATEMAREDKGANQ